MPAVHEQVLSAALESCRRRGGWVFDVADVLDALPHLNPRTVRTHVSSRCCVNAPKNHLHKWDYFRRVGRGVYEVVSRYRRTRRAPAARQASPGLLKHLVHAVVSRDEGVYVAECLELAVVTQAPSIDGLLVNLREAVELHLEGEDRAALGLADELRLALSADLALRDG